MTAINETITVDVMSIEEVITLEIMITPLVIGIITVDMIEVIVGTMTEEVHTIETIEEILMNEDSIKIVEPLRIVDFQMKALNIEKSVNHLKVMVIYKLQNNI